MPKHPAPNHPATTAKRITPGWLAILLSFVFYILSGVIGMILLSPIIQDVRQEIASDKPPTSVSDQFILPDLAAVLVGFTLGAYFLIYLWRRFYENRNFRSIGFAKNERSKFIYGWLLGLAATTVIASTLVLWGGAEAQIVASPSTLLPLAASMIILPLAWVVQGGSEELIFRGFLLQSLTHYRGFFIATLISSVCFSLVHFENGQPSWLFFSGYFTLGVFLCLFAKRQNSLWGPVGFHAAWNFSNVTLFGVTTIDAGPDNPLFNMMERAPHLLTIQAGQDQLSLAMLGFSLTCILVLSVAQLTSTTSAK